MTEIKRIVKRTLVNIRDSLAYRLSKMPVESERLNHVIFVCKGNICRSVFAELLMEQKLTGESILIESCGIEVSEKKPSPHNACLAAKTFGLDLNTHLSKGLDLCDLTGADLILTMEYWQYKLLLKHYPEKKRQLKMLRDYAPFPEYLFCNIADPYGQSYKEFETCFKQIGRSIDNLITRHVVHI